MADPQLPQGFEYVDETTAPTAVGTAPPGGVPAGFEPVEASSDVVELPDNANGMDPSRPINVSPLSAGERLKVVGLGNKKGIEDYLKGRFEEVGLDQHDNYIVKDKGLWHRVDPNNLDSPDAWTLTKELVGEVAENLPMIGAIGASAAAGFLTGGASLAAQAGGAALAAGATEAARTSLGRLEGTYVASAADQIKDVAFESALNAAGVVVGAGVKPTANWLANQLEKNLPSIYNMPTKSKEIIKEAYAKISGVGGDNMDELLNNTKAVRDRMKMFAQHSASNHDKFIELATRDSVQAVKEMAEVSKPMLRELWKNGEEEMTKLGGPAFKADLTGFTDDIFNHGVKEGMFVLEELGKKNPARLGMDETLRALSNNGGKLPKGYQFAVPSKNDLMEVFKKGGLRAGDAASDEAFVSLKKLAGTLNSMRGQTGVQGEQAVKQLMKASQMVDDLTWKFRTQAVQEGDNALGTLMADFHTVTRNSVENQMGKSSPTMLGVFKKLNSDYSEMSDMVRPLQKALENYEKHGIDTPFEQLLNKITTKPGKNQALKDFIDNVPAKAKAYKLGALGDKFESLLSRTRANRAAVAFNPMVRKDVIGQGSLTAAIGSTFTGNPTLITALGAGAAATSPRVAYGNTLMAKALSQGKDFLSSQVTKQGNRLVQNPEALNAFVSTIMQSTDLASHVENSLLGGGGQGGQ